MTDLDALYAAILAEPGEDTPRLAYADALDERGGPGDAARAEFIRLQIELAVIGRPRFVFETNVYENPSPRGPFKVFCEGEVPPVGTRVDLLFNGISGPHPDAFYPGVRVDRIDAKPSDPLSVLHLSCDEYSRPYPAARVKELEQKCLALYRAAYPFRSGGPWLLWARSPETMTVSPLLHTHHTATAPAVYFNSPSDDHLVVVQFYRGFASRTQMSFHRWWNHSAVLIAALPMEIVELTFVPNPRPSSQDKPGEESSYFLLPAGVPNSFRSLMSGIAVSASQWDALEADAEKIATLRILQKSWPTVRTWILPQFDDPE
jgi:uncharacterized protein (TIGR02996 family)